MTRAGHWAAVLQRTLARACGVVLALMLAAVTATTLQRYLLGSGFLGIEEAMVWLLLLLACLGFPMIADGALAMRIELFAHGRKSRWATLRETLAEAFTLAACGVLAIAGTKAALDVGGHSALLGLGEWMRPAALGLAGAAGIAMRMLVLAGARRMGLLLAAGTVAALMLMPVAAELSSSLLSPSLSALMVIGIGILVGAPLVHAFVLAGYAALAFGSMLVEPALALSLLGGIGRYLLLAIPFFLLAGGLLTISGAAGDLVRFAAAMVGRRRAGLGQTVLLTSVLFSGVSGSSIANAAFSSKTFMKPLTAAGYTPERAGAIIASTAVLDNIIPPSIAFLILAAATNLPVGPLLTGGLFAGLALAAALAVAIHFRAVIAVPTASEPQASRARLALRAHRGGGAGRSLHAGAGAVRPAQPRWHLRCSATGRRRNRRHHHADRGGDPARLPAGHRRHRPMGHRPCPVLRRKSVHGHDRRQSHPARRRPRARHRRRHIAVLADPAACRCRGRHRPSRIRRRGGRQPDDRRADAAGRHTGAGHKRCHRRAGDPPVLRHPALSRSAASGAAVHQHGHRRPRRFP
jgi:TRAP-type C4-dicarboxylate transport system permease small subunit